MAITDKTRKLLWGRSGNRCAICKIALAADATPHDKESVVGDECHIISAKPNGPRHNPSASLEQIDSYDNLILLCKIHHKIIDDQSSSYSVDSLLKLKIEHEAWVHNNLAEGIKLPPVRITRRGQPRPQFLIRITSGKMLFEMLDDTAGLAFDNDEPKSMEEAELLGEFFQNMRDWIDIAPDLEPVDKIKQGFLFNKIIADLENAGFFLFGIKETLWTEGGHGAPLKTPLLRLLILRNTNPAILKVDIDQFQEEFRRSAPTEPQ